MITLGKREIIFSAIGVVGTILLSWFFLGLAPASALTVLENTSAKLILFMLIELMLLFLVAQGLLWLYLPSPIRQTSLFAKTSLATTVIGLVVPQAAFGLSKFEIIWENSVKIEFADALLTSTLCVLIGTIGMGYFSNQYNMLCRPENRLWASVSPNSGVS